MPAHFGLQYAEWKKGAVLAKEGSVRLTSRQTLCAASGRLSREQLVVSRKPSFKWQTHTRVFVLHYSESRANIIVKHKRTPTDTPTLSPVPTSCHTTDGTYLEREHFVLLFADEDRHGARVDGIPKPVGAERVAAARKVRTRQLNTSSAARTIQVQLALAYTRSPTLRALAAAQRPPC